jgi:hypothetical protein
MKVLDAVTEPGRIADMLAVQDTARLSSGESNKDSPLLTSAMNEGKTTAKSQGAVRRELPGRSNRSSRGPPLSGQ